MEFKVIFVIMMIFVAQCFVLSESSTRKDGMCV